MMNKKKVLIVVGSLGVGGIEKLVANYSSCLRGAGYQLYYLVFGDEVGYFEKDVLKNDAKIVRIPKPKNRFSLYCNVLLVLNQYGPFDIVHSHVLFSSGWAMKAAYKKNVEMRIAHSHDNLTYVKHSLFTRIYYGLMRKMLNKYSTKKVACSNDAGEYLFGSSFLKDGGIILKNRIDIDKFVFSKSDRTTIRRELGIADDELLIGNIGRIEIQKNQKFIVDILDGVRRYNDAKAIVIGEGTERDNLLSYIKAKNQQKNVLLLGQKENVARYLSAMDVFILPSIHEGLGLVLIEAQANGLPCITIKNVIPNEAKILETFKFIPYSKSVSVGAWVAMILEAKRINPAEAIGAVKNDGYDIGGLKNDLAALYDIDGGGK